MSGNVTGGTSGTLTGTLAIANNGHLQGNVTQTNNQGSAVMTFDLIKQ